MNKYKPEHNIPYGKQTIDDTDIQAVVEVLKSDWLTQGPLINQFENAIASYCGVKYAVAVSNATAGLHLACLAAGLNKGDYLWTSPNTFIASANCGLYCGASVDFVDIDSKTYNMSIENLEEKLIEVRKYGKSPQVVIPVHFAGQSCLMSELNRLAKEYNFYIIEDASHAIGGSYLDRKVGSCHYSDMTVFSFHPVKIITTGEGGIITTNNPELYQKLITLRTHGMIRNPDLMLNKPDGPWYYEVNDLGYNYRITDMQAALGISQLNKLDNFVEKRHSLANRYNELLKDLPLILPYQHIDTYSAFHLYVIRLKLKEIKKTRLEIFTELRNAGIGVNVHYIPVHLQPLYQKFGFKFGHFPQAEAYYNEAITIPLYYSLTESEQDHIVYVLKNCFK